MIPDMSEDRKKPGVAFWTTVVVVVLLIGYPLSFGPACWVTSRTNVGAALLPEIYCPMTWAMSRHHRIHRVLDSYARLGSAPYWRWDHFEWPMMVPEWYWSRFPPGPF